MAQPATMVARLSKKREIRQEMSPVVGFRFFMNATPQEFLKLAGFCQSLTYEPISRGRFDQSIAVQAAVHAQFEPPMKNGTGVTNLRGKYDLIARKDETVRV